MAMELPTQIDLSNFLFFVHFSWKALIQEWYKGWCTSNNHVLLRKWYWDNIVCLSNLKLRFSIKFRALEPHNDNSNIKWCLLYIKISKVKVSKKFSLVYGYGWTDGIIELNVPMKLKCNILARHDSLMKTST